MRPFVAVAAPAVLAMLVAVLPSTSGTWAFNRVVHLTPMRREIVAMALGSPVAAAGVHKGDIIRLDRAAETAS
jgi:hypothetical protein